MASLPVPATNAAPESLPMPTLLLIRTAAASGAQARVVALLAAHGLTPVTAEVAARGDQGAVIAAEVRNGDPRWLDALEVGLRRLPGVLSVTATRIGMSVSTDVRQNRAEVSA